MDAQTSRQQPTLDADIKSLERELHERLRAATQVESKRRENTTPPTKCLSAKAK
jgi:hypothetical protein